MSAVLSDLLLLARLDAEKVSVSREPFDLAAVLSETSERFAARARAEGKTLEVHHSGKLPARGDADRTGQILAALLDNALRFTPEGGLITVEGRIKDRRVEATVADTGPGIPPDNLRRVFERFYRADTQSAARSRGPSGGGTRLGLSIVQASPAPRVASSPPPTAKTAEPGLRSRCRRIPDLVGRRLPATRARSRRAP